MASTGISHIRMVKSKLTVRTMFMLVRKYHIDPKFYPRLPEANDAITDAPEGFMGVYRVFFKSGLRLPDFDLLWNCSGLLWSAHRPNNPNGFCKVLCFTVLRVSMDVSLSITLFCYFCLPMSNWDWVSFYLYHGTVDLCDGLPTSVKYWK